MKTHKTSLSTHDASLSTSGRWFVIDYLIDVCQGCLNVLKPVFSVLAAAALVWYGYRVCQGVILDTICPTLIGAHLPLCKHHTTLPDFTHFVKVQESLYDGMIASNGPDAISALELKRVELATRDLQVMFKYSNLASAGLMEAKLGEYLVRSRQFGKNVQYLQAKTKGILDNLITYNTFMLRKLSEVDQRKLSRQELRAVYESAMALVEKEATRLIIAIENAQQSLDELEEDLYAVHEIATQEKSFQRAHRPLLLADLVSMLSGKGLRRALVDENLQLLTDFDIQRTRASQRLIMMLDRMEAFQMDLEELRSQVVAPVIVPDAIPLEVHMENIGKAIERLKESKVIAWKERPKLAATTDSASATIMH